MQARLILQLAKELRESLRRLAMKAIKTVASG